MVKREGGTDIADVCGIEVSGEMVVSRGLLVNDVVDGGRLVVGERRTGRALEGGHRAVGDGRRERKCARGKSVT